jgi:hypothetical protein
MKRLEFEGLRSGVEGMGIRAGKRDILRKKDAQRRWRKSQNPHSSKT